MKIKIEARPGEVDEAQLPELVSTIRRLAGGEGLDKALIHHDHDEKDLAPLVPVLTEAVAQAGKERDRIREVMLRKLLAVVEAAE